MHQHKLESSLKSPYNTLPDQPKMSLTKSLDNNSQASVSFDRVSKPLDEFSPLKKGSQKRTIDRSVLQARKSMPYGGKLLRSEMIKNQLVDHTQYFRVAKEPKVKGMHAHGKP